MEGVAMKNDEKITDVIIFGTLHLGNEKSPQYIQKLREIIEEIKPDLICAELSPEQLENEFTESKPEYVDAIMPCARKNGIPIIPIQPSANESIASDLERKKKEIYENFRVNKQGKLLLEYFDRLGEISLSKWREVLDNPVGIENVQLREFDLLLVEPGYIAEAYFIPELAKLWNDWNEYFLNKINEALKENRGKRIAITAGLAHKYWLWNRLIVRTDIRLYDLHSFRASQ
jgi:hypothetical protein